MRSETIIPKGAYARLAASGIAIGDSKHYEAFSGQSIEDIIEPEPERAIDGTLPDAFKSVLEFCWMTGAGRRRSPVDALKHFCVMSLLLRPEMFDCENLTQAGKRFKVGKDGLSKIAVQFTDKFGVHFRGTKTETARESHRAAVAKQS